MSTEAQKRRRKKYYEKNKERFLMYQREYDRNIGKINKYRKSLKY